MSKTLKKAGTIILCLICVSIICSAYAATMADSVFDSATTNLLSDKSVSFFAMTNTEQQSIKVTGCSLYKKNGSKWNYVCSLPVPDVEAEDTILFSTNADYSSYIGSGTYRIYTTFNADGHSISRYSNSRTF